jgi:hypothetical protein
LRAFPATAAVVNSTRFSIGATAEFARRLNAIFTVERPPGYGPIDHDWMFDDPELFVAHLDKLGLEAMSSESQRNGGVAVDNASRPSPR